MSQRPRVVAATLLAVGLGLGTLPAIGLPAFYESFLYLIFSWVALATSWSILSGYAGYFSFGHGAFFGAGMYTTSTLAGAYGVPFLWTLPVAAAIAALLGLGIGAVVFRVRRLRGELFGLLTLAITFVLATIVLNTGIDGGPGVYLSGVPLPRLIGSPAATLYLLGLVLALATVWAAYVISHSRLGLGLFAIHDDEDVAEVKGVPTFRYKLIAFGLSSGIAGAAGGVHAMFVGYVTVGETFAITVPLYVVLMSVLGGARHWLGPAAGAVIITASLYAFTSGQQAVIGRAVIALALIVVILVLPDGVVPTILRLGGIRGLGGPFGSPQTPPVARGEVRPVGSPDLSASARAEGGPFGAPDLASGARAETPSVTQSLAAGGVPVSGAEAAANRSAGAPVLECRDVWKAFGGLQALRGVSLDVRSGEILGLVGPNGSGKTTLINVISGHYRLDRGSIALGGAVLDGLAAHQVARLGVSRTYQIPRPFAGLTVQDNVAQAATFGPAVVDPRQARSEALHWLAFTGLGARATALPHQLNLHERKFLELARALAARPRLILLDEVLSGLNPGEIASAIRLVREIRERGATILFVEHLIRAVVELCDRVVVLNDGEVIATGAPRDAMRDPHVVEVYLGRVHAA